MAEVEVTAQFKDTGLDTILAHYKQLETELDAGADKLRTLYTSGQIGEKEFLAGMKTVQGELKTVRDNAALASTGVRELADEQQRGGGAAEENASHQTTLHHILGASR